MATRSAPILLEEATFCSALNQTLQAYPEVLSAIYTAHYRHVLQVCRRFFRRPEDAEDAAAEVFLKLHTVLDKKDDSYPFRPWVCQVAGRHCIDKLRRRKREKSATVEGKDLGAVPDDSGPSPLSQVLRKEANRQLREQVDRLPDHYRVPPVLRRLNKGLPAVKMVIFRAKNRLRRNLDPFERADRQALFSTGTPTRVSSVFAMRGAPPSTV